MTTDSGHGETVGELVARVGEREAYMQIVADSIRYRSLLVKAKKAIYAAHKGEKWHETCVLCEVYESIDEVGL